MSFNFVIISYHLATELLEHLRLSSFFKISKSRVHRFHLVHTCTTNVCILTFAVVRSKHGYWISISAYNTKLVQNNIARHENHTHSSMNVKEKFYQINKKVNLVDHLAEKSTILKPFFCIESAKVDLWCEFLKYLFSTSFNMTF